MANLGKIILFSKVNLWSTLFTILSLDISEPDDAAVENTPTGRVALGVAFPVKKSHVVSPSYNAPTETALAVSITEPPPTARIKSIFLSLTIPTNLSINSIRGFGTISPFSTYSIPFSPNFSLMTSEIPSFV